MIDNDDLKYNPSNRDKTREPKKGLFWCSGCDCNIVHQGEKCKYCGYINGNKCLKKPPPKQ